MHKDEIPLKELRKKYGKIFPRTNLHHLIPRSRGGSSSHFNLFPYRRSSHRSYHDKLFWNLRIDEAWRDLDQIHHSIFESGEDYIYPWWLKSCSLDNGTEKQKVAFEKNKANRLTKRVRAKVLQEAWDEAFGGYSLEQARYTLKYMMLFMIFGRNMADTKLLFNNGNLIEFFENYPFDGYRRWAFQVCFGKNAKPQGIKSKISKILRKLP